MRLCSALVLTVLVTGQWACAAAAAQQRPRAVDNDKPPLPLQLDVTIDQALIDDTAEGMARDVTVTVSKKWIGVLCKEVDETLRAHVNIPENTGLVVQQVVPDSPAEAAGLEPHDILLTVDVQPIRGVNDLVRAVSDADENGITLTWLHRGEDVSKTIQPADRPEAVELSWVPNADKDREDLHSEALKEWLDALRSGNSDKLNGPLRFRFFGPGIKVPLEAPAELPADLRIEIRKEGKEPANITVRQGNNEWQVTEDNLDDLPADVRPHVESMLGGRLNYRNLGREFQPGQFPEELKELNIPFPRMEERFDEMNRRMEQMFEELRRLKGKQPDEPNDEFNPDTDA